MGALLSIIAPVFLMILLGFSGRRFQIIGPNIDKIMSDLVFKCVLPIFLFRLLATAPLHDLNPWKVWAGYFIPVAVIWGFAALTLPLIFRRDAAYGVICGVSSTYANTVLMGIPLVLQAFGEAGMISLSILLAVHTPIMFLTAIVHHDMTRVFKGRSEDGLESWPVKIIRLLFSFLKNPIILGIISGGIVRLSGLPLPSLLLDITALVSTIAGPTALLVLGMGLSKYGVRGHIRPAFIIAGLKLMAHPALVLLICTKLLNLPPHFTAGLVLAAATPTGVNTYFFAQHFDKGQAVAATAISVSTLTSVLTITFWLSILSITPK